MATLTIRNIDPETFDALKSRSAPNQRSMEAEARLILAAAILSDAQLRKIGTWIRERFADLGWEAPPRDPEAPRAAALRFS